MSYLDLAEYKEFPLAEVSEDEFSKLESKASVLLDELTNFYYQMNDLVADKDSFRVKQFKRAMALEIDYLKTIDKSSTAELVNNPMAVSETQSIGRTSVSKSYGTGNNSNSGRSTSNLIAGEVFAVLRPTGLLFKGVGWL